MYKAHQKLTREGLLGYKFPRLDKEKAVVLVVDHQVGLMHLVRDQQPDVFRQNVFGHSALANVFNLPVILTTSAETGMGQPPKVPTPQLCKTIAFFGHLC